MNLFSAINAFKRIHKIKTETPQMALVSFGVMSESGLTAAYADPVTGKLTDTVSNSPFIGAQTPIGQAIFPANGAVTIQNSAVVITKTASLAALTLGVPTTAQNGIQITFISTTAFAHTITCPSAIINRGVTGDPVTVITLAAFPGGGITLQAYNGQWYVVANVLSTFA